MSTSDVRAEPYGEGIRLMFYGKDHYFSIEAAQEVLRELNKPRAEAVPFLLEGQQQFLGTDTRRIVAEALFNALDQILR